MPTCARSSAGKESRILATVSTTSGQPTSMSKFPLTLLATRHQAEFNGAMGSVNAEAQSKAVSKVIQVDRRTSVATRLLRVLTHCSPHTAPAAISIGYAGAR